MGKIITLAFIAVIGLGAAWFFLSPLIIDREVNEALPGFEQSIEQASEQNIDPTFAQVPSRAEVDAMTDEEREQLGESMTVFAQTAPDAVMSEKMPNAPQRLAVGSFRDADAVHSGEGEASIYALPDGSLLARFEEFRVTNGPALVVLLARAESPDTAAEVIEGGYVSLGELKGNVGNQNYTLPDGIDPAEFGSIVIWCELFDVLFSAADLSTLNESS